MTYAADFTNGSKNLLPVLTLYTIESGRRQHIASLPVSGKKQARQIAIARGHEPWNF